MYCPNCGEPIPDEQDSVINAALLSATTIRAERTTVTAATITTAVVSGGRC